MSGCQTCGGYGMKHDPIAHGVTPEMEWDLLLYGEAWADEHGNRIGPSDVRNGKQ